MIGFIELAYEPESADEYWIYHYFIDSSQQGRGYGEAVLRVFIDYVKLRFPRCEQLQLTVHPDNLPAQKLYMKAGFRATGEMKDGEPVYSLTIS
jgi:diamine N-acetyltransferase